MSTPLIGAILNFIFTEKLAFLVLFLGIVLTIEGWRRMRSKNRAIVHDGGAMILSGLVFDTISVVYIVSALQP